MSRTVQSVGAGLHDVAENGVIEVRGIDAGAAHGFHRGVRGEIDSGNVRKRAGVTRHRGARSGHNDDIGGKHEFPLYGKNRHLTVYR